MDGFWFVLTAFMVLSAQPLAATTSLAGQKHCPGGRQLAGVCVGQQITLPCQRPRQLGQHPYYAPAFESVDSLASQSFCSYNGYQVMVMSKEANSCSGDFTVSGRLEYIALGGPKGTKTEYENFKIRAVSIICLDDAAEIYAGGP
eukprot:g46327.t1